MADEEVNGIEGQIVYPDRAVDAEQAGAWAAGKADSLDPNDPDGENDGWQNPADRSAEVQEEESEADE